MLSSAVEFLVVYDFSIFFLFEMVACKGVLFTVFRRHAGKSPRGRGATGRDSVLGAAVSQSAREVRRNVRGYVYCNVCLL